MAVNLTLEERETLVNDLEICSRLGGCGGCSKLGGEKIECAKELLAQVREALKTVPVWRPMREPPELGKPEAIEVDLTVEVSARVLVLTDEGPITVGRLVREADPLDPDYHNQYWEDDWGDILEHPRRWMELPEGPKGE